MKHASGELQFVKIQTEPMALYEHVYVTTSGHAPCTRGQLRAIRHRKPIHRWLARVSGLRLDEYDSIVETPVPANKGYPPRPRRDGVGTSDTARPTINFEFFTDSHDREVRAVADPDLLAPHAHRIAIVDRAEPLRWVEREAALPARCPAHETCLPQWRRRTVPAQPKFPNTPSSK